MMGLRAVLNSSQRSRWYRCRQMGLRLRSVSIGRSCRVSDALSSRTTDEDGGEAERLGTLAGSALQTTRAGFSMREAPRIPRVMSRRGAVNSHNLDRRTSRTRSDLTRARSFAFLVSSMTVCCSRNSPIDVFSTCGCNVSGRRIVFGVCVRLHRLLVDRKSVFSSMLSNRVS